METLPRLVHTYIGLSGLQIKENLILNVIEVFGQNDVPKNVSPKMGLYADECALYRIFNTNDDDDIPLYNFAGGGRIIKWIYILSKSVPSF